jgi:hypothetical protein
MLDSQAGYIIYARHAGLIPMLVNLFGLLTILPMMLAGYASYSVSLARLTVYWLAGYAGYAGY